MNEIMDECIVVGDIIQEIREYGLKLLALPKDELPMHITRSVDRKIYLDHILVLAFSPGHADNLYYKKPWNQLYLKKSSYYLSVRERGGQILYKEIPKYSELTEEKIFQMSLIYTDSELKILLLMSYMTYINEHTYNIKIELVHKILQIMYEKEEATCKTNIVLDFFAGI